MPHLAKEPHLVSNGENGLEGMQVPEKCGIMCNKELWMEESLATAGLYCLLFLLTNDGILSKS